ncbi:MAG: thermonuclease family protein [Planctomycetota bacterium]
MLDGDTLRLADGRRVRLAAIDTPERGRDGADRATARVRELLADSAPVLVPTDPPRDRYGRLLADLEIDGASLSARLIEEGLGWVYATSDASLVALQAAAVDARRGVHAVLDRWRPGPLLMTSSRFHRADCPWTRRAATSRDLSRNAAALLKRGLAPCRTCLPWPP